MKVMEAEVDSIEELVLLPNQLTHNSRSTENQSYMDLNMLRRIGVIRKRVMQLLRLISTKADVIKTIINRLYDISTGAETKLYLEDIHDHVLTMMQNLGHYEKSLTRSHSNYLAQVISYSLKIDID
jgi:magnesium transporter